MSRPYNVYLFVQAVASFSIQLVLTIQVLYHSELLLLLPLQIVLVDWIIELMTLLFEVPTGVVADTIGRKRSILIGLALMGVGFLVEGLVLSFGAVIISAVLWGFGMTFISGSLNAWLVDEIGQERASNAFLRGTQVGLMASMLGIATATALSLVALNAPIALAGLLHLLLLLFVLLFMREDGFKPERTTEPIGQAMLSTLRDGVGLVRRRPALLDIIVIGGARGLFVGGFSRLWQAYLPEVAPGNPVLWVGAISMGVAILSLVSVEGVRRYVDLSQPGKAARAIRLIYLLMMLSALFFALSEQILLVLLMIWLNRSALATCRPIFMAWINQHAEKRTRATVISMYWQAIAITQLVSAPLIGWIGTVFTLRLALIASSAGLLPSLPLIRRHLARDVLPRNAEQTLT